MTKLYKVNFVLSDNGKYYTEDTIGLDIVADDEEELWQLLEIDAPWTGDSELTVSERIEEMVEKNIGGLKYDTYAPIQIGEHLEDGSVEVRWTDEEFRFENESTH